MVRLGTYTKRIECLELVKQAVFFVQKLSRKDMERRLPAVALSPSASEGATICVRVASSVTLQLCCETVGPNLPFWTTRWGTHITYIHREIGNCITQIHTFMICIYYFCIQYWTYIISKVHTTVTTALYIYTQIIFLEWFLVQCPPPYPS